VVKYRDRLVYEMSKRAQEIEAVDRALAQKKAEERAEVADSREEPSPTSVEQKPVEQKPDGPRGG
jgi:hypothetical protein